MRRRVLSFAPTFPPHADGSVLEKEEAASSLVGDMYALARAAAPVSPAFSALAGRAAERLTAALREAAGRPGDDRWFAAYRALSDFVAYYRRRALGLGDAGSYGRLCAFLYENIDLEGSGPPPRRNARRHARCDARHPEFEPPPARRRAR